MDHQETNAKKEEVAGRSLIDLVFSWSIKDVLNADLYKNQVTKIPKTFSTVTSYMESFIPSLIEETHADLLSSMMSLSQSTPACEILTVETSKDHKPPKDLFYEITIRETKNDLGKYEPEVGGVIALTDIRPKPPKGLFNEITIRESKNYVGKYEPEVGGVSALTDIRPKHPKGLLNEITIRVSKNYVGKYKPEVGGVSALTDIRPKPPKDLLNGITIRETKNYVGKYEPAVGDVIALTDIRPKCIDDLNRPRNFYLIAYVVGSKDNISNKLQILSSKPISGEGYKQINSKRETLFAVYLMNMTTNVRVWKALNSEEANTNVIKNLLHGQSNASDGGSSCTICPSKEEYFSALSTRWPAVFSDLNDSQKAAVVNCISLSKCHHRNAIKLIWGPPGTGKTKTVGTSLFALFKLKCRTLTCAPTNIAVLEVTERLLRLVNQSLDYGKYGLGDIILFGNRDRMKIDNYKDLFEVFLDTRVSILSKCFAPLSGWKHWLESMIGLLEHPEEQYSLYIKERKDKKNEDDQRDEEINSSKSTCDDEDDLLTFEKFVKEKFDFIGEHLKVCLVNMYTHLPTSCITLEVVKDMIKIIDLLKSIKFLLYGVGVANERLQLLLEDCADVLKSLRSVFVTNSNDAQAIRNLCLENACLIFCTASSSAKLHTEGMAPLELLVIDEAAQLKECESAIPLQLPGLRHAILIGDERQLPAMVKSKISEKAEYGRSLFGRLVQLGLEKHLLNVQYRMHPSISLFPKMEFYDNQILDGPNVKEISYEKRFLEGKMYGSYSFINVANGKEEFDRGRSQKNMVEMAVVYEIVAGLYREFTRTKKKVSVGVISPYKAQVHAIEERVREYSGVSGTDFSVSVRSVDGFQGGEEDVIIISTVRCNGNGSLGFLSNRQRANVLLTRARHCLWILGNEATLINSNSIWKKLILDAKKRDSFYNADEDKNLAQAIAAALLQLDQLHILLNADSLLFKNSQWKVCFAPEFKHSMEKIKDTEIRQVAIDLLKKLSNGWRQPQDDEEIVFHTGTSAQLLEKYEVDGLLYLIWSVDILKENSDYIQVMKIWDILALSDILILAKRLDKIFGSYTVDKMNRCKHRHVDGVCVVPKRWPVDSSSCDEDDPVEFLPKPLSSLSLTDMPDESSRNRFKATRSEPRLLSR